MKQIKEFKISCHSINEIMAGEIGLTDVQNARLNELSIRKRDVTQKPLTPNMEEELSRLINKRDNPVLPAGAKTHCEKWLKKALFGRKEDWKSIVIDKGLACEEDGIKLISEVYGLDGLIKNEEFFFNEFCQGSPDMVYDISVRDSKLSWDLFTFPMFKTEIPDDKYWWQLQGYMWIVGMEEAYLDYVLIDTPMPLVLLDLKKLYYQSGGVAEEWTQEKYEYLYPNYQFNDIPNKNRIKTFKVEFDKSVPDKIKERVLLCRKYINETLLPQINK